MSGLHGRHAARNPLELRHLLPSPLRLLSCLALSASTLATLPRAAPRIRLFNKILPTATGLGGTRVGLCRVS